MPRRRDPSTLSKGEQLFRFRKRYATTFDIPIDDVEERTYPDGETVIWAPKHPEFPEWSTGK